MAPALGWKPLFASWRLSTWTARHRGFASQVAAGKSRSAPRVTKAKASTKAKQSTTEATKRDNAETRTLSDAGTGLRKNAAASATSATASRTQTTGAASTAPQTTTSQKGGFKSTTDTLATKQPYQNPAANAAASQATRIHQTNLDKAQAMEKAEKDEYKRNYRKAWSTSFFALPILLVSSYYLFGRCECMERGFRDAFWPERSCG